MRSKSVPYILVLLCLWGLSGASCVDNNLGSTDTAPEGEGYFAMNVDLGDLQTSTRSGDEEGLPDELKVYSVRVVLYDGNDPQPNTCKVEYVFDLDIRTPVSWTNTANISGWLDGDQLYSLDKNGKTLRFVTTAQRVGDKPYKMLVLINGADTEINNAQNSIYNVTRKGCYLYQFSNAVKVEIDPLTGVVKNGKGIFMSNHQELVPVSQAQLKATGAAAVGAPVDVSVDRMVAKVTVKHSGSITLPDGIDPTSARWGLAVTNRKTYLVRKGIGTESAQTSMANLYAEDPNYSSTSIDMNDNFNNVLYRNSSVKLSPASVTNQLNDYEYTLENTISAVTSAENAAFLDQATHVVVGYKYTPAGYGTTDSYYIYNNKIISVSDMNIYRATGAYIPDALTGLDVAIAAIDQTEYRLDGYSTSYFESKGIRFCPQGQVYYYFPIRHFDQQEGSLGYYGVVRNNIYEITINSLSVPESSSKYLSAEIHILPWAMRGQENNIGIAVGHFQWMQVKIYHTYYYGGPNLYSLWTGGQYEYQTIVERVGTSVNSLNYSMETQFRTMPSYNGLNYTYSIPDPLVVSTNAATNVITLVYTSDTYAGVRVIGQVPLCFVDENNTILKVSSSHGNINPDRYYMVLVRKVGETYNYIYFRHLPEAYNMTITNSSGVEYVITSATTCAVYYRSSTAYTPTSDNKIDIRALGGYPNGYTTEPALSGPGDSVYGETGIGIICVPK